jgi:hypothetical protein
MQPQIGALCSEFEENPTKTIEDVESLSMVLTALGVSLRHQGRFEESITAAQKAHALISKFDLEAKEWSPGILDILSDRVKSSTCARCEREAAT